MRFGRDFGQTLDNPPLTFLIIKLAAMIKFYRNEITYKDLLMNRTNFESLVTFKSLAVVHEYSESTEHVMRMDLESGLTKNVCFRITTELFNRLETTTKILGISKRPFLESLLIDGLNQAEKMMKEEGVFEHFREMDELLNAEGRFTEEDKAVAEGENA